MDMAQSGSTQAWLPFVIHTLLLPISCTIGAGIKTASDLITRTSISKNEVDKIIPKVENITQEEMAELVNSLKEPQHDPIDEDMSEEEAGLIKSYSPKSNSSYALFHQLSNDQQHEDNVKNCQALLRAKKIEFASGNSDLLPNEMTDRYLDYSYKYTYKQVKTLENMEPKTLGFEQSKNNLIQFMKNNNNNGKELFRRIVGFFATKEEYSNGELERATIKDLIRLAYK